MKTHKNIVFMGNFIYPKGMADTKRIQHFIDYLIKNDVDVQVLLLRQGEVDVPKESEKGYYKNVQYRTIGNNIKLNVRMLIAIPQYFIAGANILHTWLHRTSNNVLYCYGSITIENVLFIIAAKAMGYRIIFDIVEDNTHLQERLHLLARWKWYTAEFMERYLSRYASAVIVISEYLKKLYEADIGVNIPVHLIPISADCSKEHVIKQRHDPIKFVYSGSFAKKDGVEQLIEAFENIYQTNKNCHLLMTGKGANLRYILERTAHCPGIQYMGYLEDDAFYNFLNDADVLCITRTGSKYANAGFPFKLGEYLATGNPVIVSNISDVSCYLEHMKDAIIVEPDNLEAIQSALNYCINNSEEAREIGLKGRQKCKIHFNPDHNGQKLLDVLYQLN